MYFTCKRKKKVIVKCNFDKTKIVNTMYRNLIVLYYAPIKRRLIGLQFENYYTDCNILKLN